MATEKEFRELRESNSNNLSARIVILILWIATIICRMIFGKGVITNTKIKVLTGTETFVTGSTINLDNKYLASINKDVFVMDSDNTIFKRRLIGINIDNNGIQYDICEWKHEVTEYVDCMMVPEDVPCGDDAPIKTEWHCVDNSHATFKYIGTTEQDLKSQFCTE